ncbi:hypothetical protein Cgig2_007202 [Carnegiea gigantea]|uniref:Uncharacterized protein n=1 Tax=Carnegiea gigantea TaxID=171969 RepID=A0A9Q1GYQ6_9CARY|nr:hypothetical protein Cgig2_007202 [Carnegiea gigantea]
MRKLSTNRTFCINPWTFASPEQPCPEGRSEREHPKRGSSNLQKCPNEIEAHVLTYNKNIFENPIFFNLYLKREAVALKRYQSWTPIDYTPPTFDLGIPFSPMKGISIAMRSPAKRALTMISSPNCNDKQVVDDKEIIASMAAADCYLENSIVDMWYIITNNNQLSRHKGSSNRFYFTTYVYMMNIIDNLTLPKKPTTRYDSCDTLLIPQEVKDFQIVYVKTDYPDNINLHDCGIYTMCHMETHYESLLTTLRAKYAARILLHPNNLLRDDTLCKAKLEARATQQ